MMGVLRATPFFDFFNAIKNGSLKRPMIQKFSKAIFYVMHLYDRQEKGFKINTMGKEVVRLSSKLTSVVFGIRMGSCEINDSDKLLCDEVDLFEKYFSKKKYVTKMVIKDVFDEILEKSPLSNEDKVDLVKLIILYSVSGMFFASTSAYVGRNMMAHFKSIKLLNNQCWPRMITNELRDKIDKFHDHLKSVQGCVYLILYMLLEHTNVLEQEVYNVDQFPRMLKWNLSKINGENWDDIKRKMEEVEVYEDISDLNEEEIELVSMSEEGDSADEIAEEVEERKKASQLERNPLEELSEAAAMTVNIEDDKVPTDKSGGSESEEKGKRDLLGKKGKKKKNGKKVSVKVSEHVKQVSEETGKGKGTVGTSNLHMLEAIPNTEANRLIEENYRSDPLLRNVDDEPDKLKNLLRREKTIRDKMSLKVKYLEGLVETRKGDQMNDEIKRLNMELRLMESTYCDALKLYELEATRSDLSVKEIVRSNQKNSDFQQEMLDKANKELEENKELINQLESSVLNQKDTITSCRKREIQLLNEMSEIRLRFEEKEKEFNEKMHLMEEMAKEKSDMVTNVEAAVDEGTETVLIGFQAENEDLKKECKERMELCNKMREDLDRVISEKQEELNALMEEKGKLIEKLKNTVAHLAGENKDLKAQVAELVSENKDLKAKVEDLDQVVDGLGGYPIDAIPLYQHKEEETKSVETEKKGKLSDLKTRAQRQKLKQADEVQKTDAKSSMALRKGKGIKGKDEKADKPIVESKKKKKGSKGDESAIVVRPKKMDRLEDPKKSKFWKELHEQTRAKLLDIYKNDAKSINVWVSQHPSVEDTIIINAETLEDLYMGRAVKPEIIDYCLRISNKDYSATTTQEVRTLSIRAADYDNIRHADLRDKSFESIRSVLGSKLIGGEMYVLAPMRNIEGSWSLLYLDVQSMEWHHYNPLDKGEDRIQKDFKNAEKFKKVIEKYMKPILAKILSTQAINFKEDIVKHEEPKQKNRHDSGVYICIYAFRLSAKSDTMFNDDEADYHRCLWTDDILANPSFGFDRSRPFEIIT